MHIAKEAEVKLKKWWVLEDCSSDGKVSIESKSTVDSSSSADTQEKISDLIHIITNYFNPAIQIAPHIQLLYLLRAKALVELSCFDLALEDVKQAHARIPDNKRGLIGEKLVQWKRREYEKKGDPISTQLKDDMRALVHSLSPQSPETHLSLSMNDFECMLCLNTLHTPITSPCGHTFCKACILKTVEHSRQCPLCRSCLPSCDYYLKRIPNKALEALLHVNHLNASDPVNVKMEIESPLTEYPVLSDVPIFVCSLIFPGSRQKFHIFEARYRVLMKRVLEKNKRFGICLPGPEPGSFLPIGTLVEITQSHSLPNTELIPTVDGDLPRFFVQTKGLYRFQVKDAQLDPAGYHVGQIVRLLDIEPDEEWNTLQSPYSPVLFSSNVLKTKSFLDCILSTLGEQELNQLHTENGPLPENPADIPFWIADLLPIDPMTLYQLLTVDSVNERFRLICEWIEGLCCESK